METLLAQVQSVLVTTAGRWLNLTDKLSSDLLTRAPAPGEWSASDCLRHLLDTEHVFGERLRAFMAGQDIPAFDPDTEGHDYGDRTAFQLADDFARHRSENLAVLEQVGALDLARTVQHSELGSVTLAQLLQEWAAHDLMHTVQAERALMQPFIAGSGPWRDYFRDHDVALANA
jgi:uncharacterized damage-inducible protein DinB